MKTGCSVLVSVLHIVGRPMRPSTMCGTCETQGKTNPLQRPLATVHNPTIMPKQRTTSGLTGVELVHALGSIHALLQTEQNGVPCDEPGEDNEVLVLLRRLYNMVCARANNPRVFSGCSKRDFLVSIFQISTTIDNQLDGPGIECAGILIPKKNARIRAAETDKLGATEHWSSRGCARIVQYPSSKLWIRRAALIRVRAGCVQTMTRR